MRVSRAIYLATKSVSLFHSNAQPQRTSQSNASPLRTIAIAFLSPPVPLLVVDTASKDFPYSHSHPCLHAVH